jgi:hypothetical protein
MHYSEEEKAMWLEDWRQSGKSAYVYAKANGLVPWTFIRWTRTKTENKSRFVEIPGHVLKQTLSVPEILIEKGDVKIHIPLGIGSGELCMVMERLGVAL